VCKQNWVFGNWIEDYTAGAPAPQTQAFIFDANGNMTQRVVNGQSYTLAYDAENRMTAVSRAANLPYFAGKNQKRGD